MINISPEDCTIRFNMIKDEHGAEQAWKAYIKMYLSGYMADPAGTHTYLKIDSSQHQERLGISDIEKFYILSPCYLVVKKTDGTHWMYFNEKWVQCDSYGTLAPTHQYKDGDWHNYNADDNCEHLIYRLVK